ncbi:MAG TPA: tandem-95 repeat protein [Candidatus Angelobacter sp.]|nr:tandem-95 repeat protein [Candidatus Angelobacter sp.]
MPADQTAAVEPTPARSAGAQIASRPETPDEIVVHQPAAGEVILVDLPADRTVRLAWDASDADLESTGNQIRMNLPNGGAVVIDGDAAALQQFLAQTLWGGIPTDTAVADASAAAIPATGLANEPPSVIDMSGGIFTPAPPPQTPSALAAAGVLDPTDLHYHAPDSLHHLAGLMVDHESGTLVANAPPLAVDDAYTIGQDGTLIVAGNGVLGNDSDADGDALTAAIVTGPANGTLTLNTDGSFTYVPNAGFTGGDSFTYRAADGHGGTAIAAVSIAVTPADPAPTAVDDLVTVDETLPAPTTNLTIVLDRSGSMATDPDGPGGFATRFDLAKAAIADLLASYGALGSINVLVVAFNNTSVTSGWLSGPNAEGDADNWINALTSGNGTNYSSAVALTTSAYGMDTPVADRSVAYFITDGEPTAGTSLSDTGIVGAWEAFATANAIDAVYAVGVNGNGAAINLSALEDIAWPNVAADGNPVIITTETDLSSTLLATVVPIESIVTGDVLANDSYGVDGPGYIQSIVIGATTFTYDPLGNAISDGVNPPVAGSTLTTTTPLGATLTFDFATGQYSYTAPSVTGDSGETFAYTIVDATGTSAGADLVVTVDDVNRAPLAESRTVWLQDNVGAPGAALLVAAPGDPDGDTLTVTVTATPAEGVVHYDSTGSGSWVALTQGAQDTVLTAAQFASLTYQPDNDGAAEDLTLTYTVDDGTTTTAAAVTIHTLVGSGINVAGSGEPDTIYGTSGADTLAGGAGADLISAGAGNDQLDGGSGNDRLLGGDGADTLTGGGGNDSIAGGNGNDSIHLGSGMTVVDGGAGLDLLDFSAATGGLTFTLVQGGTDTTSDLSAAGLGIVTYRNMEGVVGSSADDLLTGSGSADILRGGGGNDTLIGGSGNDTLTGGAGNDLIDTSAGNDRVVHLAAASVLDTAANGTDSITGFDADAAGGGQDVIDLTQLFDSLGAAFATAAARQAAVQWNVIDATHADLQLNLDGAPGNEYTIAVVTLAASTTANLDTTADLALGGA